MHLKTQNLKVELFTCPCEFNLICLPIPKKNLKELKLFIFHDHEQNFFLIMQELLLVICIKMMIAKKRNVLKYHLKSNKYDTFFKKFRLFSSVLRNCKVLNILHLFVVCP